MTRIHRALLVVLVAALALTLTSAIVSAQSASASLAAELGQLMDQAGLDSIAASDPGDEERFVAALYFSGRQLLAVSASYSAPILLDMKIANGQYRDVYIDLNSASAPESRFFVDDLGADGLQPEPSGDAPADSSARGGRQVDFDSDWSRQQMSEDEYQAAFADADSDFAGILTLLIAQIKGS